MGAASSVVDAEGKSISRKINETLVKEAKNIKKTVKVLLLGAAECGKSTTLKQIRLIQKQALTEQDLIRLRPVVWENTLQCFKSLIEAMQRLNIPYASTSNLDDAATFVTVTKKIDNLESVIVSLGPVMKRLWTDDGIQTCYERSSEFQLLDCAHFFLTDLDRICSETYTPTMDDFLYMRIQTCGAVEFSFVQSSFTFRFFDVGGQRSQRRKWIQWFDCVNVILFIAAISEYDQTMQEDSSTNRLHDSIELFESIASSAWFTMATFILFLNKIDLFKEKIAKKPITAAFPNYSGAQDYEGCCKFLLSVFETKNRVAEREIFSHFTCATDTSQVQIVLEVTIDSILERIMRNHGLS